MTKGFVEKSNFCRQSKNERVTANRVVKMVMSHMRNKLNDSKYNWNEGDEIKHKVVFGFG